MTVETEDIFGIPVETVTGHRFLPQTPETFTYDADGNLLSDGRWNYTWDGENRLTRMETRSDLPANLVRERIDFQYDFMGRRFMKRVYEWDGVSWVFVLWERYLYDGWMLAGREGGSLDGQRTQHYRWGLDESGTLGGAGDVGGLLLIHDLPSGEIYYPTSDANGNIIALWDGQTGEVAARYDYDPFGNTVRATGDAAEVNPFRFSTKYQDAETGLYYYGYRYYSPEMGRWLNRDPIGEQGGVNLYGMVENDPVNWWDYLGLWMGNRGQQDLIEELWKDIGEDPPCHEPWYQAGMDNIRNA